MNSAAGPKIDAARSLPQTFQRLVSRVAHISVVITSSASLNAVANAFFSFNATKMSCMLYSWNNVSKGIATLDCYLYVRGWKRPKFVYVGTFVLLLEVPHEFQKDDEHNHHRFGIHEIVQSFQKVWKRLRNFLNATAQDQLFRKMAFVHQLQHSL